MIDRGAGRKVSKNQRRYPYEGTHHTRVRDQRPATFRCMFAKKQHSILERTPTLPVLV